MTGRRWAAVALYVLAVALIVWAVPDALGLNGRRFPVVLLSIPVVFLAGWLWETGEGKNGGRP